MSETYNQLVEIMMNEDDDAISEFIIMESDRDDVMASLDSDTTLFNYLMLFEEFLDIHDLYLFNGWEKAAIVGSPKIEKFWATFMLLTPKGTDLRGAKRIKDAMGQGQVDVKKQSNGTTLVQFMILKRELDQIETTNKDKIEKLSVDALDKVNAS